MAWAAQRDNLEIAALLIRAGAKVNAANDYPVGLTDLTPEGRSGSRPRRETAKTSPAGNMSGPR